MERLCDKYGRKKVYILGVVCAFILFVLVSLYAYFDSRTFHWEGTTFKLVEQDWGRAVFIDDEENVLNITLKSGQLNSFFLAMDIDYVDKKISYDSTDFDKGVIITLSDGSIYVDEPFSIDYEAVGLPAGHEPIKPSEVALIDQILNTMNNHVGASTLVVYDGFCFILILVGFMNILYPEISWKMKYCLDVDGGEPSEFYIVTCKLGSYILIGAIILSPLFYLFSIKS
nr:hypothetical protein [uncultured Niameybacter sp.]